MILDFGTHMVRNKFSCWVKRRWKNFYNLWTVSSGNLALVVSLTRPTTPVCAFATMNLYLVMP